MCGYIVYEFKLFHTDGELKRAKVKDTCEEEQQKLCSKMLVGTRRTESNLRLLELDKMWKT